MIVDPSSLAVISAKFRISNELISSSRLIYFHTRSKLQWDKNIREKTVKLYKLIAYSLSNAYLHEIQAMKVRGKPYLNCDQDNPV